MGLKAGGGGGGAPMNGGGGGGGGGGGPPANPGKPFIGGGGGGPPANPLKPIIGGGGGGAVLMRVTSMSSCIVRSVKSKSLMSSGLFNILLAICAVSIDMSNVSSLLPACCD